MDAYRSPGPRSAEPGPALPEPPVPIASAAAVWALFTVPTAAVDDALRLHGPGPVPATGGVGAYRPVSVVGRTPVVLALVRYHDVPGNVLGAYLEVVVAVPVRARGGTVHPHVLAMPVTQELTRDAGQRLWRFPKWLTTITGELRADGARARVLAGDLLETAFALELGPAVALRRLRAATTAVQHRRGEVVLVPVRAVEATGLRVGLGGRARFAVGAGPLADVLRTLGLPGRRPLAAVSARRVRARIDPARPLP